MKNGHFIKQKVYNSKQGNENGNLQAILPNKSVNLDLKFFKVFLFKMGPGNHTPDSFFSEDVTLIPRTHLKGDLMTSWKERIPSELPLGGRWAQGSWARKMSKLLKSKRWKETLRR